MPYILPSTREAFKKAGEEGHQPRTRTAGELNYEITLKLIKFIRCNGLDYQSINDVIGALEGAKAEFQRRVVAPYEDRKIKVNGDVYPPEFITK